MGCHSPSPLGSQCSSRQQGNIVALVELVCGFCENKHPCHCSDKPYSCCSSQQVIRELRAGFGKIVVAPLEITGRNVSN